MASSRDHPFGALLRSGLAAYDALYGRIGLPTADDEDDDQRRANELADTLPEPRDDLSLTIVTTVANRLLDGDLTLVLVPDFDDPAAHEPLEQWLLRNSGALDRLVPEAQVDRSLGWADRAATDEWGGDADVLLDDLTRRTRQHIVAASASPVLRRRYEPRDEGTETALDGAFVLLRDAYQELAPLIAHTGADPDEVMSRATAATAAAEGPLLVERRAELTKQLNSFPMRSETPARALFAAFAECGVLGELDARLNRQRVVAALRGIAVEGDAATRSDGEPDAADAPAASAGPSRVPSTAVASDAWTTDDRLGYATYADAIVRFLVDDRTHPPLTIGIKAPWGAGKTSLMRMIRQRLDPAAEDGASASRPPPRSAARRPRRWVRRLTSRRSTSALSNREVLRLTRRPREEAAARLRIDSVSTGALRTTIWFNAWKYQSSEQLWAGLGHAIISQVEARMTTFERERFWASLNLRRVDVTALRRRIYRALAVQLVPTLLAAPFALLAIVGASLVSATAGDVAAVAGPVLLALDALRRAAQFAGADVAGSAPGLVRDPGYADRLGFLHLVHEDLGHVLELVTKPRRPLVVFIDDLDRCSYTTVAQVIEALNTFLAGDFRNCVFVVAMEPELVAAQISVAYADLFDHIAERNGSGSDLGWRFLEKMVQLPLTLPLPTTGHVERLVDALAEERVEARALALADTDAEVEEAREAIRAARTDRSLDGIGEALSRAAAAGPADRSPGAAERYEAALRRAAREEYASEFDDGHAEVSAMLRRYASQLDRNPREIKRFVNLFRFYAYVHFWRRTAGRDAPGLDGAGKLAMLAVRCPHLLGALAAPVGRHDARSLLERLELASDDAMRALVEAQPERVRQALDAPRLLSLLRAQPRIGAYAGEYL